MNKLIQIDIGYISRFEPKHYVTKRKGGCSASSHIESSPWQKEDPFVLLEISCVTPMTFPC